MAGSDIENGSADENAETGVSGLVCGEMQVEKQKVRQKRWREEELGRGRGKENKREQKEKGT